jgi:hypothetical protein
MGTKPIEKFCVHYTNEFNELEQLSAIHCLAAKAITHHKTKNPRYFHRGGLADRFSQSV